MTCNLYLNIYIYIYIYNHDIMQLCVYIFIYLYVYMGVSRLKLWNSLRSFREVIHSRRKTMWLFLPAPNLETDMPSYRHTRFFWWQIETSHDELEQGNPHKRKNNKNSLIRTLELGNSNNFAWSFLIPNLQAEPIISESSQIICPDFFKADHCRKKNTLIARSFRPLWATSNVGKLVVEGSDDGSSE